MPKVLVVDDSPTVALKLSFQLKAAGFDVSTQKEGRQALASVIAEDPDIVMLDITLPDIECPEVVRQIKKHAEDTHTTVPVVLYSGLDEEEMRQMVERCGADNFLHKSCSLDDMVQTLSRHMRAVPDAGDGESQ